MWAPAVQLPANYQPSTWHNASVNNDDVNEMMQQGTRARIHPHTITLTFTLTLAQAGTWAKCPAIPPPFFALTATKT